jgi:galactokinase
MIPFATAASAFTQAFSGAPSVFACAPGRVNLIGEHVDYAGGRVLPVALSRGVSVAAAPGQTGRVRVHSDQFMANGVLEFRRDGGTHPAFVTFVNALALETGALGADIAVVSDLPVGRGWSSSAAFAVAVAGALIALDPKPVAHSPLDICLLAQRAETTALGVACGLMDQYAAVFGRPDAAVLFDTASLSHEYIPLNLPQSALVVVDSGQPRRLAVSGYNQRRQELSRALDELATITGPFQHYREVDPVELLRASQELSPKLARRVRHIVTEDQRVGRFAELLRLGEVVELGRLLTAAQCSLSDDYEVSTDELDRLCRELDGQAGVYGTRLVGGGFGGSVLSLAHERAVPDHIESALRIYHERIGLTATYELAVPGDGAQIMLPGMTEPLLLRDWLSGGGTT